MNKSCAAKHWWSQVCSKALARGAKRSVFVITSGQPTALKFTMRGEAPRSLSVSVADMGPEGVGDALRRYARRRVPAAELPRDGAPEQLRLTSAKECFVWDEVI